MNFNDKAKEDRPKTAKRKRESSKGKSQPKVKPKTWTPKDDLLLKETIISSLDLKYVVKVPFSNHFSNQEIIERWRSLLYDREASEEITKQICLMPPIVKRVPLSSLEEELLKNEVATGSTFQAILEKNRTKFHPTRTTKQLEMLYNAMKKEGKAAATQNETTSEDPLRFDTTATGTRYIPYSSFTNLPPSRNGTLPQFEKHLYTTTWVKPEELKPPEKNAIQSKRREYIKQEDHAYVRTMQLEKWYEVEKEFEKDPEVIAKLKNQSYNYSIKKHKILLGRDPTDSEIDVNLVTVATQGLPKEQIDTVKDKLTKLSRRQAYISFDNTDCEFYIHNIGKPHVVVSGHAVPKNSKHKLTHNSLIEILNVQIIFEINNTWLGQLKQSRHGHTPSLTAFPPPSTSNSQSNIPPPVYTSSSAASPGFNSSNGSGSGSSLSDG
eukprot:TRINITY_DN9253_c0_g1_i1.p1 TRINITY_DN9253_c0_g1~~TRINITY_DN9253_c0_g1_i1.p1  ORF type:complete len:437 (-),score=118.76 TRINITY_DN9253_c0_g1_i1:18-1328(-)